MKKFFVLYSLRQRLTPLIYKTKSIVNRHLNTNKSLNYLQFDNQQHAKLFIEKFSTQLKSKSTYYISQNDVNQLVQTIVGKKNHNSQPSDNKVEIKSKKIQTNNRSIKKGITDEKNTNNNNILSQIKKQQWIMMPNGHAVRKGEQNSMKNLKYRKSIQQEIQIYNRNKQNEINEKEMPYWVVLNKKDLQTIKIGQRKAQLGMALVLLEQKHGKQWVDENITIKRFKKQKQAFGHLQELKQERKRMLNKLKTEKINQTIKQKGESQIEEQKQQSQQQMQSQKKQIEQEQRIQYKFQQQQQQQTINLAQNNHKPKQQEQKILNYDDIHELDYTDDINIQNTINMKNNKQQSIQKDKLQQKYNSIHFNSKQDIKQIHIQQKQLQLSQVDKRQQKKNKPNKKQQVKQIQEEKLLWAADLIKKSQQIQDMQHKQQQILRIQQQKQQQVYNKDKDQNKKEKGQNNKKEQPVINKLLVNEQDNQLMTIQKQKQIKMQITQKIIGQVVIEAKQTQTTNKSQQQTNVQSQLVQLKDQHIKPNEDIKAQQQQQRKSQQQRQLQPIKQTQKQLQLAKSIKQQQLYSNQKIEQNELSTIKQTHLQQQQQQKIKQQIITQQQMIKQEEAKQLKTQVITQTFTNLIALKQKIPKHKKQTQQLQKQKKQQPQPKQRQKQKQISHQPVIIKPHPFNKQFIKSLISSKINQQLSQSNQLILQKNNQLINQTNLKLLQKQQQQDQFVIYPSLEIKQSPGFAIGSYWIKSTKTNTIIKKQSLKLGQYKKQQANLLTLAFALSSSSIYLNNNNNKIKLHINQQMHNSINFNYKLDEKLKQTQQFMHSLQQHYKGRVEFIL